MGKAENLIIVSEYSLNRNSTDTLYIVLYALVPVFIALPFVCIYIYLKLRNKIKLRFERNKSQILSNIQTINDHNMEESNSSLMKLIELELQKEYSTKENSTI